MFQVRCNAHLSWSNGKEGWNGRKRRKRTQKYKQREILTPAFWSPWHCSHFLWGHVPDKGEIRCSLAVSNDTAPNFPLDKRWPKIASGPTVGWLLRLRFLFWKHGEEARHLPTYPLKQLPWGISTLVPADAVHLPNSISPVASLSQACPAMLLKEALQEGVIGFRDCFLLSVNHYCLFGSWR